MYDVQYSLQAYQYNNLPHTKDKTTSYNKELIHLSKFIYRVFLLRDTL